MKLFAWTGRQKLLRRLTRISRRPDPAEAQLQSAFLRVEALRRHAPAANDSAFLIHAAADVANDGVRRPRPEAPGGAGDLQSFSDDLPLQDEMLLARERLGRVRAALARLPEQTRAVFLMHRIARLKHRDIAARLGVSLGVVEKHIARASLSLADWMDGEARGGRPDPDQADARAQAAAWVAVLQSEARTPAEEAGFRDWLAERAEHQRAFDRVTTAWEAAGGLAADYPDPARLLHPAGLRGLPLALALGAVVLALAAIYGLVGGEGGVPYATAPGETRRVGLQDGSSLLLDADTRVEVHVGARAREVVLERGRIHVEPAIDPTRPFVIAVGPRRVLALGPAPELDVTRGPGETSVVPHAGVAAVQASAFWRGVSGARLVAAGERLSFADHGPVREDIPDLAKLTAWESGQALFEADTLAAAAIELNRYSRRPLVIDDPAVARLKVSGRFRAGATEAFADAVAAVLPVRAVAEPGRIRLVARLPK